MAEGVALVVALCVGTWTHESGLVFESALSKVDSQLCQLPGEVGQIPVQKAA